MKKRYKIDKSALAFGLEHQSRNRDYLDTLRELPCGVSGFAAPSEPAHIINGGKGLKCHDYLAMPMHPSVHRLQHAKGWSAVIDLYPVDHEQFQRLLQGFWFAHALCQISGMTRNQLIRTFE